MRLLRLAHSIWDHYVVGLCFFGPCLRAPGRGEPGFRGGLCPGLCCFLLLVCDPGSSSLASSHCFTCKKGLAQIHEDKLGVSFSLAMTDQVAWTTRQLSGKKNRFVKTGGYQFVMTQTDVPKCSDPIEYVKRHYGKPLDAGRLVAIRFLTKDRPQEQFVVFALIMDTELRKKADWLKASSGASVKDKGFGNALYNATRRNLSLQYYWRDFCTHPCCNAKTIQWTLSLTRFASGAPRRH